MTIRKKGKKPCLKSESCLCAIINGQWYISI